MSSYYGIGLMSGSSLDGLDICYAEYMGDKDSDIWSYRFLNTETIPYDEEWYTKLVECPNYSGADLVKLDRDYGHFIGKTVKDFIARTDIEKLDFVASHGHTVFHQPEHGFTYQIGEGETISSHLTCPVVTNFRDKDVALGGQGAPLVPAGEQYLFTDYSMCLNLGGIANISVGGKAFDVSPCNMLLNHLANRYNKTYTFDSDGKIAESGNIIDDVLQQLNSIHFYEELPPKSLGREWFETNIVPVISKGHSPADLLATSVEHISEQIARAATEYIHGPILTLNPPHANHNVSLNNSSSDSIMRKSILITGGGAKNKFLMKNIADKLQKNDIDIAECDDELIDFKEAMVFGFL
ncbi:unnamed protein product, partial [Owenia fusiformis]